MIVGCRPIKVASFGGRNSFVPQNEPKENLEEFSKYNLFGWEAKEKVFDSDADIVDHQVAIIEYENGATLAFHTNMRVPDEFRRFAVIGTNGMVEGDFVRGFIKAHDQQNNIILEEDYGAELDIMINAGPGSIGESTILDCTGDEIEVIREGLGYSSANDISI